MVKSKEISYFKSKIRTTPPSQVALRPGAGVRSLFAALAKTRQQRKTITTLRENTEEEGLPVIISFLSKAMHKTRPMKAVSRIGRSITVDAARARDTRSRFQRRSFAFSHTKSGGREVSNPHTPGLPGYRMHRMFESETPCLGSL
jgi:hypothetical protein